MSLQRVSEASVSLPGRQLPPPTAAGLCGHPVVDPAQQGGLSEAMARVFFYPGTMMSAQMA